MVTPLFTLADADERRRLAHAVAQYLTALATTAAPGPTAGQRSRSGGLAVAPMPGALHEYPAARLSTAHFRPPGG